MTGQENERLAVVETKVSAVATDVAEIKTDVKSLASQVSAIKSVMDRRGGFGDAFRTSLPLVLSFGALVVAVVVR